VLDPLWPVIRRVSPASAALLGRLEAADPAERLVLWIEQSREAGADEAELATRAAVAPMEVRRALAEPLAAGRVHALRRSPDRYVSEDALARLGDAAAAEMRRLLPAGAATIGVPRRTLMSRLLPRSDPRWAEAVESALAARGAFHLAGEEARPPGREELPGSERELSERILAVFRERGLDPPTTAELAERVRHRPKVIEGLVGYLAKKGDLTRLPGGWLVGRDAVESVVARLRGSGKTSVDVGEFKAMFGLTRRLAIPLLEHLDASRVTRRVGDRREIVR
jgi:selenocysteine-specific elongation factor